MKKKICFILFSLLLSFQTYAQQDVFVGTFINALNTVSLRLKPVGNDYHGLVQSTEGLFVVAAKKTENKLLGVMYTQAGNIDFTIIAVNGNLSVNALGKTDLYYKFSADHELGSVDLTPYMNGTAADYNYSYSQHNGNASEHQQTHTQPTTKTNPNGTNDPQLFQLIAGSQLVYYTRTSYLNDSNASSITYVNFCANGRFSVNYDGSFMVEGNYGGNAQGAGYGRNSGTWQLQDSANGPMLQLNYGNGQQYSYPVYKNYLLAGRWKIGNTQYAMQRNKAVCY